MLRGTHGSTGEGRPWSAGRRRILRRAAAMAWLVLVCLIASSCGAPEGPPEAILGQWVTSAPAYKGKYFEVRPDTLTIETGSFEGLSVYSITRFVTEEGAGGPSYTIEYIDEYGETGSMRLSEERPGLLQVGEGTERWTRKPGASPSGSGGKA